MSNKSLTTQNLADIKALLDYVRVGLDGIVKEGAEQQLDNIGQATLTGLTALRDIQYGIEESEARLLELHSQISKETFKNLEEPLKGLLKSVKDSQDNQDNFLNDITKAYSNYESSIRQMEQSLKESKDLEYKQHEDINKTLERVFGGIETVGKQLPKEESYQASLKEIDNSINRMIESERLNNDRHQEVLDKVKGELSKSQNLLAETNKRLDGISDTYEQSTGRLSVLDLKLNILTDILLGNKRDTGGADDEC